MGVSDSKEEARLAIAIQKLSKVEIRQIEDVFQELSYVDANGKHLIKQPTWLDREKFAERFGLPDFLGEQLFAAFDRDQNEVVDMNEFLAGMALFLHGNVKDKCRFLFKIFNLNNDEGISQEELTTVLTSSLQSAHGVLSGYLKDEEKGTVGWEMKITETVERIVNDAFAKCDTSKNGRLELEEFEHWVHKNPKLINSMFLISPIRPKEDPATYDVIPSPLDGTQNSSLRKEDGSSQEIRKLSDMFGSQSVASKDAEGESFFDTLGISDVNAGLTEKCTDETNLESASSKGEKCRSGEIVLDREVMEEPGIPVDAEEILHHHAHLSLLDDKIASRNSEMSLVSLGQSTGDLTTLDTENEEEAVTEKEADTRKELEAVNNAIGNEEKENEMVEGEKECEEGKEMQNNLNLDLDFRLADDKMQSGIAEVTSPWHPLKAKFGQIGGNDDKGKDDMFEDAADVIRAEKDSEIKMKKSGSKKDEHQEEVLLTNNPDIRSAHKSMENPIESNDLLKSRDSPSRTSDSLNELDTQAGFEQIAEPVMKEETSKRPSTLEVGQRDEMTNVDLAPGDHAIGKPTLRQLAEMKEFDKSPSLEDTNSSLQEARLAAWLPSEDTRHLIEAVSRGLSVDSNYLTYPSVLLETSLGDPVKDLVCKFLGEEEAAKRPIPTADSVTMNDAGLKSLLASQCWRGAIDWTAKYLTAHGQGNSSSVPPGPFNHTPKLLQIWFVRIALLFKLKSFSSAEAELNAFGDFENPDLFYEFYPLIYPGMKGSMVPFSLRVIHAEVPQHNGRPQETLDRLYRLLSIIKNVSDNLEKGLSEHGGDIEMTDDVRIGAIQLWEAREVRVLYAIGNCLISIKEYTLAMKVFSEIIKKRPTTKSTILSGVGRLHLQLGDIKLAKKYFKKVEKISLGDPKTLSIIVMNRGFVALAEGKYDDAFENFQSVTKLDPDNSSACNNASVALLFQGKVKEACTLLETLIWKSPKKSLHEDIIFNLCTIYELHRTSKALQKKHKLLHLICRHKGDGFNVQSLTLT